MHRSTARTLRTATSSTAGLALLASLTLTAPASAAPAPETPDTPVPVALADETETSREVLRVAQEAQQSRSEVQSRRLPQAQASPVTDALDAGMAQVVADGAIGVAVRVDTPTLTWAGADGVRAQGRHAPAGWQDRFRVASITKTMVATLVLQEVQAGSWTLDTRVEDVIPGLFPEHPEVTVRQLLNHTSGIPNGTTELLLSQMEDRNSLEELLAALGRDYADQDHIDVVNAVAWTEPGEFLYSNAGYVALGMLLEAQTGRTVESLLRQRIFTPAGMRHSSYPDDPGLNGPVLREDAWVGPVWGDGWLRLAGFDPDVFSHAGAAVSTTRDLNLFNEALLTGRLVEPELLAQMLTPVEGAPMPYGLGVYAVPDPCAAPDEPAFLWGHDGLSFGTQSVVLGSVDGTRQLSLGVTGRDSSGPEPRWDLADVLVPALLATCG